MEKCWTFVLYAFAPLLKISKLAAWILLLKDEGENIQGDFYFLQVQGYPPLEMPNNNRAKFDLSKVPTELKKTTLEHILTYRTFKHKESAHKKLRHQMLNDFKPKESTFRDGTQLVKHVVNEELQHTLQQNECEMRLQFHRNDVDAAKTASDKAH